MLWFGVSVGFLCRHVSLGPKRSGFSQLIPTLHMLPCKWCSGSCWPLDWRGHAWPGRKRWQPVMSPLSQEDDCSHASSIYKYISLGQPAARASGCLRRAFASVPSRHSRDPWIRIALQTSELRLLETRENNGGMSLHLSHHVGTNRTPTLQTATGELVPASLLSRQAFRRQPKCDGLSSTPPEGSLLPLTCTLTNTYEVTYPG